MATEAQIRYAKGLLEREDRSPNLYPIDKDTPIKAASWLIDQLKNGLDFSPEEYADRIRAFSEETPGAPPPSAPKEGAGYTEEVFRPTLQKIQTPVIKSFLQAMIKELPPYFYWVKASTSGKYHPDAAREEGGLVNHTLIALHIADDVIDNPVLMKGQPPMLADKLRAALAIHDGWKQGLEGGKHTIFTHPLLPRMIYEKRIKSKMQFAPGEWEVIDEILDAIDSHMGPWNTSRYDSTVLPLPSTHLAELVHLCDYIASRTYIDMAKF